MKAKLVERETEEKFEPFSIEITFESRDEAERFYAMYSCAELNFWRSPWEMMEVLQSKIGRASDHLPENRHTEMVDGLRKYMRKRWRMD